MRFVHCADVHLDSPMRGLEAYESAPVEELKSATRRAFENIIELCLDERAAFLIIAGDLFDGDWPDFNTGLFFIKQMARLREAGIRVFLVRGNHDAQSRITRQLPLPDNVTDFPSDSPATVRMDDAGIAVHGCSFASPDVRDNLAQRFPPPVAGHFNIGVLHTALNGREGHEPYAPCTQADLATRGYDYWALGHVHQREVVSEDPAIMFPGNVQARHIREAGEKGCTVVTLEAGRIAALEHRCVDVARWTLVAVDAAPAESPEAVLDRVREALAAAVASADGRLLAARVRIAGRSAAHEALIGRQPLFVQEVRASAADVGVGAVWIEKVDVATRPLRRGQEDGNGEGGDALAQLMRIAAGLQSDPQAAAAVLEPELRDVLERLPPEARHGGDALSPEDPEWLTQLIEEAAGVIGSRLQSPDE